MNPALPSSPTSFGQESDNPFRTALLEGAAATYLALLRAGLAERFDPLPTTPEGLGLFASMLDSRASAFDLVDLCRAAMALGLDPAQEQARPEWRAFSGASWGYLDDGSGGDPPSKAPLASLAIGSRNPAFEPFWREIPAAALAALALTAMPVAVESDNVEAIRLLCAAGVSPDSHDSEGRPAPARARSPEALTVLIEAGSDLFAPFPWALARLWPSHSHPTTVHEAIISRSGEGVANKSMRELAVAWVASRPESDAVLALGLSAAKAIESDNRDAARRCVAALGTRALTCLTGEGDTLATLAARCGNFTEVSRLLAMGADPFEVAPSGRSVRGEVSRWAGPSDRRRNSHHAREKAQNLLDGLARKRKYQPVPWDRKNAGGATLLSSLAGALTIPEFLGVAETAFALGASPRDEAFSGMDLPCRITLHLIVKSSWMRSLKSFSFDPEAGVEAAEDFLAAHPPALSSQASKAALGSKFWHLCAATALTRLDGHDLLCAPAVALADEAPFRALLLEGIREWGAQGGPAPAPFSNNARGLSPALADEIACAFESGALHRAAAEPVSQSSGPSRI